MREVELDVEEGADMLVPHASPFSVRITMEMMVTKTVGHGSAPMDDWRKAGYTDLPKEWTWDEYLEASKKMTVGEGDKKIYGGSDYHSINYFTYPVRQVKGYDAYYKDDGTSNFDDPLMLEALKREIKAEVTDKIWFPLTVYRSDSIQSQVVYCNHQVASVIIPNVIRFIRDTKKYPVTWQTGFAPYPVEKKGQKNYLAPVSVFSHGLLAKHFKPVIDQGVLEVINQLRASGKRVICGTNVIAPHFQIHQERGDYAYFDKVYPSFVMKLSKPDPEFYRYIIGKEGVPADRFFFVDDTPKNVESALAVGME